MSFKQKLPSLFVLFLLLPGVALAATDVEVQTNSLSISEPETEIPLNSTVEFSATVSELLAEESVTTDLLLLINEEEVSRQSIVLEPGATSEVSFEWLSFDLPTEFTVEIRAELTEAEDVNTSNNSLLLSGLQVVEALNEDVSEDQSAEDIPLIDSPLVIYAERLAWNQFRLRPTLLLANSTTEYEWDFGDGVVSTSRVNEHTYAKPGTYQVTLQVFTPSGERMSTSAQVHVGFFHLANWRLWVLVILLALIILVGASIASFPEKKTLSAPKKPSLKSQKPLAEMKVSDHLKASMDQTSSEPIVHQPDSAEQDLDVLAQSGSTTEKLEDELSFLEELEASAPKPKDDVDSAQVNTESVEDKPTTEKSESGEAPMVDPFASEDEPEEEPKEKKKAKKKTTKKKSTGKKKATSSKKKATKSTKSKKKSSTKKKATKKKSTKKSSTKKKSSKK